MHLDLLRITFQVAALYTRKGILLLYQAVITHTMYSRTSILRTSTRMVCSILRENGERAPNAFKLQHTPSLALMQALRLYYATKHREAPIRSLPKGQRKMHISC